MQHDFEDAVQLKSQIKTLTDECLRLENNRLLLEQKLSALQKRILQEEEKVISLTVQIRTFNNAYKRLEDGRREEAGDIPGVFVRLQKLENEMRYITRPFWQRLVLRRNGRPVHLLRRFFFHTNGRPRGVLRKWIFRRDGQPRQLFYDWMISPEYQALPRALLVSPVQPFSSSGPTMSPRTRYFLTRLKAVQPFDKRD